MNNILKRVFSSAFTIVLSISLGFGAFMMQASTAHAATLSPTALSSASLGTSGTNATPITVTSTAVTSGSVTSLKIILPTGWSFVTVPNTCAATVTYSVSAGRISACFVTVSGDSWIYLDTGGNALANGDKVSLTFKQGVLNLAASRDFNVELKDGNNVVDSGLATLAVGTNHTVTFDGNGGTGTTAAQTSLAPFALTANGFTKTGASFTGWNTAANGSGTAYAATAFYPFTSDETLYAQWSGGSAPTPPTPASTEPTLAATGNSGQPFAFGAVLSLLAGAGLVALGLIKRKKAYNL